MLLPQNVEVWLLFMQRHIPEAQFSATLLCEPENLHYKSALF
jgi:hypothetical protein